MEILVASKVEDTVNLQLEDKSVIIIDVLRATTTIITALANGAEKVIPVLEPEDAFSVKEKMECILGGERKSCIITGFDCGNSPYEYPEYLVKGKTVVISTTNGTRALHAVRQAKKIYLAALINTKATAAKIIKEGRDCVIVCSGTEGQFSSDDFLAAGAILAYAKDFGKFTTNDVGDVALSWYLHNRQNLYTALTDCFHGQRLMKLDLAKDLLYCSQENLTEIVPGYNFKNNCISL